MYAVETDDERYGYFGTVANAQAWARRQGHREGDYTVTQRADEYADSPERLARHDRRPYQ